MATRSYIYLGNGLPVAITQAADGLWELTTNANDSSSLAVASAISGSVAPVTDESVLLPSAVYAATQSSVDQIIPFGVSGVLLFLNVTVAAGALKTLKLDVEAKDPVSGVYTAIASSGIIGATVTLVGNYLLFACPFIGTLLSGLFGNQVQIPRTWRAKVTPSDSSNWTYSLGRSYLR